jgi:hypothetical protein
VELTDAQIGYFVDNRLKLPQGQRAEYLNQVDYLIKRFTAKVEEESAFGIKKWHCQLKKLVKNTRRRDLA